MDVMKQFEFEKLSSHKIYILFKMVKLECPIWSFWN